MTNKILELQKLMLLEKIDALLIPSHDEFYSEIVPPHKARLEYLTGFSGSNGIAVITTSKKHFLFTDGRYLVQAKQELSENFEIIDLTSTSLLKWLESFLNSNILGLHNKLHSIEYVELILKKYTQKNIKILDKNLVDIIWQSKPQPRTTSIFEYKIKYSGTPTKTKLENFKQQMKEQNIDTFILNTPESICWLLNIRGQDSLFSPIVFAYLIITQNSTTLFLDATLDKNTKQYFNKNQIEFFPFSQLENFLDKIKNHKNIVTTKKAPFWLKEKIATITTTPDLSELPRACKNKTEISNAVLAHNKDSIALTHCLIWIKEAVKTKKLSEISISDKLLEFRSKQQNFMYPSFNSIVGFKENGAIIHYKAQPKTNKKIFGAGLLLIDSGGQYLEGTTDTTRTIVIGTPTKEQIRNFTLVLKGHIQLLTAIFPEGTTGNQLDTLARNPLWKEGKDYAHGTGHGVGSFLSVHEGPQAISRNNHIKLQEGMILSIEPGFYKTKKYGIRIENLAYIKKSTRLKGYLEFEVLTKVPIETQLVDFSLLTTEEKNWLNNYNEDCNNLITESRR
ncbi:MAG: aminopeptidase P family protein [Rickettsiales bacterium]|nr:aminopeptidase P family protein [Rickettsiales bacterium]